MSECPFHKTMRPEFRAADGDKWQLAIRNNLCWVCGQRLGSYLAFVIGPMCENEVVNEELIKAHSPGLAITRQPGVVLIWVTRSYQLFRDQKGGRLIEVGDPLRAEWYSHGRQATREEILASIESGMPILKQSAEEDGIAAIEELDRRRHELSRLLPAVCHDDF